MATVHPALAPLCRMPLAPAAIGGQDAAIALQDPAAMNKLSLRHPLGIYLVSLLLALLCGLAPLPVPAQALEPAARPAAAPGRIIPARAGSPGCWRPGRA